MADARSRRGTGTTLAELFREDEGEDEGEGEAIKRPLRVDLSGKLSVLSAMVTHCQHARCAMRHFDARTRVRAIVAVQRSQDHH